ncbi:MAG TPA: hypothetical protein VD788_15845, partial [Candidatus Polarisedimenticolaceae bacterium]|nr:hypothetical protein [Candidatus Polarisedimenticolaceae bacterium]
MELLEDQVHGLAVAESPAEVFKALIDGARIAAPRTAVFLVRQDQLKGWGTVGYPVEAATRQRAFVGPSDRGWFGEVLRVEQPVPGVDGRDEYPDFGQPSTDQFVGLAVRVKGRPIAVLVGERTTGQLPWHPQVLGILVRVAQLRLDLDLVRRKLAAAGTSPGPPLSPGGPAAPGRGATRKPSVIPPAITTAPVEPTPESVTEVAAATPAPVEDGPRGDARHEAARRYARLVATDIRLYNEEA